jgi:hypothetical protein
LSEQIKYNALYSMVEICPVRCSNQVMKALHWNMSALFKGQTDPAARLSFFGGRLRLRTLVFLRWLAVVGQAISIVLVSTVL